MVAIKDELGNGTDPYVKLVESLLDSTTLELANVWLDNYNLKQKIKFLEEKIRVLEEEITSGP